MSMDSINQQVGEGDDYALVVFAHLGWDWVWQRPQQLLSRMSKRNHHVYYVMEPWITEQEGTPKLNTDERTPEITLVWPVFSGVEADTAGGDWKLVGQLVDGLLKRCGVSNVVYWLYTPLAEPAIGHLGANEVVVFDAMDELANFRFAPPVLREREAALMSRANLVFTGGPSLYRARKDRHPRVYLFSSGVDRAHYAKAYDPETVVPEPAASLPAPRIGFFGVLDERIDLDLLRRAAELEPDWHFILVGPTAKIDPAELPHGPNLHYPGKRDSAELPGFCKGLEVCIMPFALNEATRFISPTKTLEYMAAGKPIVSTPIKDVAEPYSHIVRIAATPEDFVAAIQASLDESPIERASRQAAADEVLDKHEWDNIASEMLELIDEQRRARSAAQS